MILVCVSKVCSFAVFYKLPKTYLRLNYLRLIYAHFLRYFWQQFLLFLVLGCIIILIILVCWGWNLDITGYIRTNFWTILKVSVSSYLNFSFSCTIVRYGTKLFHFEQDRSWSHVNTGQLLPSELAPWQEYSNKNYWGFLNDRLQIVFSHFKAHCRKLRFSVPENF